MLSSYHISTFTGTPCPLVAAKERPNSRKNPEAAKQELVFPTVSVYRTNMPQETFDENGPISQLIHLGREIVIRQQYYSIIESIIEYFVTTCN